VYPALLPLMRTTRLSVVDRTDAPADLNGLVLFVERRNLVSARVSSHLKRSLPSVVRNCQNSGGRGVQGRGGQITGARLPAGLKFIRWLIIFVESLVSNVHRVTILAFRILMWRLEFRGGF